MKFIVIALILTAAPFSNAFVVADSDPKVVKSVNLKRYAGLWYEIGRFPTFFQKGCERSTAKYTLRADGDINVLNTCFKGGKALNSIESVASVPDRTEPAKLVVDFGFFRTGDYWITHLDPNYQWAVVSGPGKASLFILARVAPMDTALRTRIVSQLKRDGFDTSKIIYDKY